MITFEALTFGDIIRFKGSDYIFLAKTEDITYLASILDKEITKELKQWEERLIAQNSPTAENKLKSLLFCYVLLETDDYKGQAAQYGTPGKDNNLNPINKLAVTLNRDDLNNLRDAIIKRPPNTILKELVEQVTLL